MTADVCVFRALTDDPARLMAEHAEHRKAWADGVDTWLEAVWDGSKEDHAQQYMITASSWGPTSTLVGLVPPSDASTPLPFGWRRDKRQGALVPRGSTKAGKRAMIDLAAHQPPRDPRTLIEGMPPCVMASGEHGVSMNTYAVEFYEGSIYVRWEISDKLVTPVDPALWEPVSMSAYWMLREAKQALAVPETGAWL